MPLDDNDLDLASSSGSETLDAAAEAKADAVEANSSAADGAKQDNEPTSIARDVIAEAADRTASPTEQKKDGEEPPAETSKPKEPDNENFSDVPFHKHPRFQQVLRERNTFREDAKRYQNIETFLENNGLSAQDAAEALLIRGLANTNPQAALERLMPQLQRLFEAAGEVLPPDLKQLVDAGQMTPDAALAVSRARAQVQSVETQRSLESRIREQRQQKETGQATYNAALTWENERRERDPNFEQKLPFLHREIAYLQHQEGRGQTPEAIRDQFDRAYKEVNKTFRSMSQQPAPVQKRPIKPVMGGQVASGNAQPAPRNTLEIIRAARAG